MSLRRYSGFPYYSRNWEEVNKSLFKALRLERVAIAIFLGLIILVAALDIVSALTMVVMEKGRDIAILRAMGATRTGHIEDFCNRRDDHRNRRDFTREPLGFRYLLHAQNQ